MEVDNITSKSSFVFKVPELLSLICGFARTSDCARLLRTCRMAFNVAVASVWNQADGQYLLLLLGGATRKVTASKAASSKKIVISLGSPSMTKFSRFGVYAPHVRELNVYGPGPKHQYYQVDGWDQLILHARHQPLLPNLSSVIFLSFTSAQGSDELTWIKTFISPSLTKVEAVVRNTRLPVETPSLVVDVIMDTLARSCPRLLKLSLFPTSVLASERSKIFDNLVGFFWRRPYDESLADLSNLVELTCNMAMFEGDSLVVIGLLPALHRLTVLGLDGLPISSPHALPTESFPALRELRLAGLYVGSMISLLSIPPLMSRLTHLELECRLDDPESDDEDDRGEWIVSNLLSRLENSPHLLSLSLDINYFNEPHNIGCDDLMEIFSELPLEAISLTGVQVDDWAYNAEHLKTVWLNVTSIHLLDQHGSPSALECFAQLPRLQYLKISLYLEEVEYCPDDEASLCPLHTLESSDGDIAQEPEDLEFIGE
ncbi:hypothetical protein FS749_003699 [Ceratobasidium sp. UAMH 11750]|nr:hypothetical protein FS749_003699 [Ceratobasidium sp. UAMH 11750]